ncbi:MAG TPA: phosphatidate cytidylyltransferase [Candidatus Dormibacteraeota bacterium]
MNLAVRTASGVALLGLFLAALFLGDLFVDGFVAVFVGLGLWEYWQLWRGAGLRLDPWLLVGLAAFWLFRYAYPGVAGSGVILLVAVLVGLTLSLRFDPGAQPFLRWALAVAGAAWLGFCPGFLLLLYHGIASRPRAAEVVLLTVGISVIGDTLAYLVGSRFGRHPFFARISPRKTWEGALAALVAPTVAVGLLLPLALPGVHYPLAFGLGLLAAVAAIGGDLVESQLKREVGVKDSGRLLPGHGGVLDRMDSLIFVGAVVYSLLGATHSF